MTQSALPFEHEKTVFHPAYQLLRIFFAVSIPLGPLTFLLYGVLAPVGRGGQALIASNMTENTILNMLHLLFGVLASYLLPISFLGLSVLALRRTPWLGSISVILSLPAWTPLSAFIALDALTYDMAKMGGSAQFVALWEHFNGDDVIVSYTVIYAICHLLCAILVGVALGRVRLIPIWAAVALVISSPLIIIGFAAHLSISLVLSLICLTIGSISASVAILQKKDRDLCTQIAVSRSCSKV